MTEERHSYVHCVRTDAPTYCGRPVEGWLFQSAEHARLSIENMTTVVPCPDCMAAIEKQTSTDKRYRRNILCARALLANSRQGHEPSCTKEPDESCACGADDWNSDVADAIEGLDEMIT